MKKKKLACYVRAYRKQWGFTEEELAYLLGAKFASIASRLENEERPPTAKAIIAYEIIFGTHADELFPGYWTKVEYQVIERARELYDKLQGNTSKVTRRKLDCLEWALERYEKKHKQEA